MTKYLDFFSVDYTAFLITASTLPVCVVFEANGKVPCSPWKCAFLLITDRELRCRYPWNWRVQEKICRPWHCSKFYYEHSLKRSIPSIATIRSRIRIPRRYNLVFHFCSPVENSAAWITLEKKKETTVVQRIPARFLLTWHREICRIQIWGPAQKMSRLDVPFVKSRHDLSTSTYIYVFRYFSGRIEFTRRVFSDRSMNFLQTPSCDNLPF